ncbi:colicin-like pore-forming protein [Kerstersia gyiorum]|nr:colicin-like pore-forming protein [Kerstersia gyiorum]MCP1633221.1 hypothetical protein [Kerstersia gyiorum]MCP1672217.1 hypothetical protein [Kerstersia gyiorum]MCP1681804.1 hypothetical protein [Kerstersia gyiorum]MCP1710215.1 hypothetical protein [Kerstersia gyiorum]MCP1717471.1 hypothetical protein [Kerstersia gyiorum]
MSNDKYDYRLIKYWENGRPFSDRGVHLMPTQEIVAEQMPGDDILNLIANNICAVCGEINCPHWKKEKSYQDVVGAYRDGAFDKLRRIFKIKYAALHMYDAKKNEELEKINADKEEIKESVKFAADFHKETFEKYGEKAEHLSKSLADKTQGKNVRNVDDALKAYEKYRKDINKKINRKDRDAIATALESIEAGDIANNFKKFSKGLGYTSGAIDFVDWLSELANAVKTDNWRPFFIKTGSIAAGLGATTVAGLAFSVLLGTPVGILGYSLIMASLGALIDDEWIEEAIGLVGI